MKCEVREICGDWALDINNFNGGKITIYFNSRQNALNVKRILEVDDSIPNAATVCDMQEVVRCKDCKYAKKSKTVLGVPDYSCLKTDITYLDADDFCSYRERKMKMMTDKEALQTAKEELERALYLSECSRSAGIRAINEDKAEWLSILICNAEQYMRKEYEGK